MQSFAAEIMHVTLEQLYKIQTECAPGCDMIADGHNTQPNQNVVHPKAS